MNTKKYDGYQSFSYLERRKDYPVFELDDQVPRVSPYEIELTEEQEDRVKTIFSRYPIVSLRDHGFIVPRKTQDILPYCKELHTSFHYEGLAQSGLDVMFENFMDGISIITSKRGLKWDDFILMLGMRYADISKQNTVFIAKDYADLVRAKKANQIAILPSLEAANILENEVDRVDVLYGFGIRSMGITYNDANTLGSGLSEKTDGGLTNFGHRVIERMNRLGMVIDISHCGDQTSLDVIRHSTSPVFITHAGARALWNTPRMKPDYVLKACAERGGIIGICAAPNTTLTSTTEEHSIDSVMQHMEYVIDLVGIDHVAFGPDTFYGDHVAIQRAFDESLSLSASHGEKDMSSEAPYVKGVENPTEAMKNIVKWLVKHHYSQTEIAKLVGKNALRVLNQVLDD